VTDLLAGIAEARARLLALVEPLVEDGREQVPALSIINPPVWELGHAVWFQRHWLLRRAGGDVVSQEDEREEAELWNSAVLAHDDRWLHELPDSALVLHEARECRDRALRLVEARGDEPDVAYFARLAMLHEDMHVEALLYTYQTLGYARPDLVPAVEAALTGSRCERGDVEIPGGSWSLGKPRGGAFVFDNEKWAHSCEVEPFRMARTLVSEEEFAAFVDDGGYTRRSCWSEQGWAWRARAGVELPLYWRRCDGGYERREFDVWRPLRKAGPMVHLGAHEADAFCVWAGRRLPTELEWEVAALCSRGDDGKLVCASARWPWGARAPDDAERARAGGARPSIDLTTAGPTEVDAPTGCDSPLGLRQMLGSVWQWTASTFEPYPGFSADPYREYSRPWYDGEHRTLRGAAWTTSARLACARFRNFYRPERRDIWAGLRTCAR